MYIDMRRKAEKAAAKAQTAAATLLAEEDQPEDEDDDEDESDDEDFDPEESKKNLGDSDGSSSECEEDNDGEELENEEETGKENIETESLKTFMQNNEEKPKAVIKKRARPDGKEKKSKKTKEGSISNSPPYMEGRTLIV